MKTRSAYMENERSIPLYPAIARALGDRPAIVLQQIRYWMQINEESETRYAVEERPHFKDGRWWVFNTYEEWQQANFDFWSKKSVERYILILEQKGVLISTSFNKEAGDMTKWYTIDFDKLDALIKTSEGKRTPLRQTVAMVTTNCPNDDAKLARSIYIDSETTTETTTKTTEESATATVSESSQPVPADEPAAAVEVVLQSSFFDLSIDGFSLDAALRDKLIALPRLNAVALMLQAKRSAKTSAPGLLMSLLRADVTPQAEALRLAPLALELETLEWSALDAVLKRRELVKLTESASEIAFALDAQSGDKPPVPVSLELGGERASVQVNAGKGDGLDQVIVRNLTAADVWRVAKWQLQGQWNKSTFDNFGARIRADRYADGKLTLRVTNDYIKQWLERVQMGSLQRAVRQIAEKDIQIEVVV